MLDMCVPAHPGATPASAKQMIQMITDLNHATPPLFSFFLTVRLLLMKNRCLPAGSAWFSG